MGRVVFWFLLVTGQVCHAQTDAPVTIDRDSFNAYLIRVSEEAKAEGIKPATISAAFDGLEPDERVIRFDRRQPEFVQTFDEYLGARVTEFRRREGRRLFELHRDLLEEVAATYQVDPEYLVAFWGLETSFGRYQGKYSIIRSLATLGHDARRSAFFTAELVKALKILDEQHVTPEDFVGAWAGAMGQGQFMPSSFLAYAQDYDGDGRKDIWHSEADVFASIAYYLSKAGWKKGAGWGAVADIPDTDWASLMPESRDMRCRALKHHTVKMTPGAWLDRQVFAKGLNENMTYALIVPSATESANGRVQSYLAGGNFRAILSYNCANKYAVSVGLLADAIANPGSS